MNMFLLYHFITSVVYVKKINPDCKDCIFYSKGIKDKPSICKKYGEKEDITGRIIFYESKKCRDDVFRCGESGKYFQKK
jgi:hypothetical protein